MRVLHIVNDYCGSKVHQNLYKNLDLQGVEQMVYTYFRDPSLVGKNSFEGGNTVFEYRTILKKRHRLLYHRKIATVSSDLIAHVESNSFDLVHATTLFSDGAVAYRLWKKRGVPYVVTVRNTDINEFLGYAPHTWALGLKVLRNARKIVFISKAPMEKFCRHFAIRGILNEIESKFVLQPNGVDDYWIDHQHVKQVNMSHNLIYVGKFDVNKNVVRLIKAVLQLRKEYPDVHLHLVGGDGWREKKILEMVEQHPKSLTYHGKIFDKDKLRDLFEKCSIFAMPSIHETFGLVYIEALTQKLAVLYTKKQGIDGLFDTTIGEGVNAFSVQSIRKELSNLLQYRDRYNGYDLIDFEQFRWSVIAQKYVELYKECI